jgi:predicted dehydrogenase
MIQIALLGAGVIGRDHAHRMTADTGCQLHSVTDPTHAGAVLASTHGVPHHADLDALLASRPRPDAALIATPNDLHVPQAIALLRRGIPVLIEKPVAASLEAGAELLAVARATGVPTLVGHHRRHSAVLQAAQASIAAGELGRLVAVNTTVLFHKPASYFEAAWRRAVGGGPILINLVHEIDALRFLVGEIRAVQAMSSRATRGFEVEDTAAVLLEFANGTLGTLLVSDTAAAVRSWEQTSGENPAYARDDTQDCIFLAGTRGSLAVPTLTHWQATGSPSWNEPLVKQTLSHQPADPLVQQLRHFAAVVRGEAVPLVSAADGLASLRATLTVHQAAANRQRVELPLSD